MKKHLWIYRSQRFYRKVQVLSKYISLDIGQFYMIHNGNETRKINKFGLKFNSKIFEMIFIESFITFKINH